MIEWSELSTEGTDVSSLEGNGELISLSPCSVAGRLFFANVGNLSSVPSASLPLEPYRLISKVSCSHFQNPQRFSYLWSSNSCLCIVIFGSRWWKRLLRPARLIHLHGLAFPGFDRSLEAYFFVMFFFAQDFEPDRMGKKAEMFWQWVTVSGYIRCRAA